MMKKGDATPKIEQKTPTDIRRMFSVKKTLHKDDFSQLKITEGELPKASKFSMYESIRQLPRTSSDIPTELSFDELNFKNKVYDFMPLTYYKLGSLFSRGTSPSNANSNLVSTTATAPFNLGLDTKNPTAKASEMNRLFLSRTSVVDGKNFKPKTVMAVTSNPSNDQGILNIGNKKSESHEYRTTFIRSPSNQKDIYSGFLNKLSFTTLLEGGERILKEISKSIVKNGKTVTVTCITWESGSTYEGEIVSMRFHGFGVLNHISGYSIRGDFVQGKVHGRAEFVKGKQIYSGQWKSNLPHGQGIEKIEDKFEYAGNFIEGIKQGKGKMKISGKGKYEGEFKLNSFYGFGCFTWLDGKRYMGNWVLNLMHGKGKMTWPDGRKFEGKYSRNKKEGYGQFTWADGRAFVGLWKNGKQEGNGKYINLGGEKGQAIWEDGKVQIPEDSSGGLNK